MHLKKVPVHKTSVWLFLCLALLIFAGIEIFIQKNNSSHQLNAKEALGVQSVNKEFQFPLKDLRGEDIGTIEYMIEKAELRDEIIVKGQRATAIPGHAFLVLSLKITNNFKQAVQVTTRDYVRLSVNGDTQELIAPEIHNDPVEVQAISTKTTSVGFPLSTSDSDISLWVGEINAEKERIPITLN
jgi:hypothetical protein